MELSSINIDGLTINGYQGDYIFESIKDKNIYYEYETLQKWLPIIKDVDVILDVGANIGNHSLFWSKSIPNAIIYSFEPYKESYLCLKENIAMNDLQERIIPFNIAIGESEGYVELASIELSNLGSASYTMSYADNETEYQAISIDHFISTENITGVDFIKIDTEGFELSVLKGMKTTIKRFMPIIWLEVSCESYKDVNDYFEKENYKLIDVFGFNMLYAPNTKTHVIISDFTKEKILTEMFKYLEKTNFYYKAYNKAKGWNVANNKELNDVKNEVKRIKRELDEGNRKYYNTTEQYSKLRDYKDKIENRCNDVVKQLDEANRKYRESSEQYSKLQEYSKKIESQKDEKAKQLDEANKKYRESSDKCSKLQDYSKKIEKQRDETAKQLDEANRKYRESSEQYSKLQEYNKKIENQKDEISKQRDESYQKCSDITKLYEKLRENNTVVLTSYNQLKEEQVSLTQGLQSLKLINEEYAKELTENMQGVQQDILLLQNLKQTLTSQQAQINYLKQENNQYRAKLARITDTWYGGLAIKCYRIIKKIYNRLPLKRK